jgi:hypothetical protein
VNVTSSDVWKANRIRFRAAIEFPPPRGGG